MVQLLKLLVVGYFGVVIGKNEVTVIDKNNVLLSRKRRYLLFPVGTNMAISFAGVKALLRAQPTGFNILGEIDCPFALPSDTRIFRKTGWLKRNRREIYSTLSKALTLHGFNGTECITKMICDAKKYVPMKGKSMIKDILLLIFDYPEEDFNNAEMCTDSLEKNCTISIMEHILEEIGSVND